MPSLQLSGCFAVLFASVAAGTGSITASRKARWYVNGDVTANVAFARSHPGALTGFYGCCGLLGVDAAGNASLNTNLTSLTGPMKHAVEGRTLSFHAVFSVAEPSIHSRAALNAVPDLVRFAREGGADGILCDYEPADNYTDAHAQAYADFLAALASQAHAQHLEVGFDVAGWGILDNWGVLAPVPVDFYTSMTPTYNSKVAADRAFTTELIKAVGVNRTAIGIGSMPAPGYESGCKNMPDYGWNQSSFSGFTSWLRADAEVQDLDIWRCDIDHYGKTAPWFIDAVVSFLGL